MLHPRFIIRRQSHTGFFYCKGGSTLEVLRLMQKMRFAFLSIALVILTNYYTWNLEISARQGPKGRPLDLGISRYCGCSLEKLTDYWPKMKCITFTDIRVKLTTLPYLARLFLTTTALVDSEISEGESLSLHLMKCKVVFDHDSFRSGNFGRRGTFFSSQTKGNFIFNQAGLKSGRIVGFITSHNGCSWPQWPYIRRYRVRFIFSSNKGKTLLRNRF